MSSLLVADLMLPGPETLSDLVAAMGTALTSLLYASQRPPE